MRVKLKGFQEDAVRDLLCQVRKAQRAYCQSVENDSRKPESQVVSFTAPTGAGKTVMAIAMIESFFYGDEHNADCQNAVFLWLSDSPELNEQSKSKMLRLSDGIEGKHECVMISEDSFDLPVLEDGNVYFLNTQKLSKGSRLVRNGDDRNYTIWQTLENTARKKGSRFFVIIDEAHRGTQGQETARATTIMQKFIKGSDEDKLSPMPVVIGMSATIARFNNLVTGMRTVSLKSVTVWASDVRTSGLLKERIVIIYPEDQTIKPEMTVLQAAACDWKEKCERWAKYCKNERIEYINPAFIVQVENASDDKVSSTNLFECVKKIEEEANIKFRKKEVVHTFGNKVAVKLSSGFEIPYANPSTIANDDVVKLVFFKENLSTGWDCPRAETMMSFRHATDATYIAQLLGRMVRTPLRRRIEGDETLNDVKLFLPFFNRETVHDVVKALQDEETGEIPTVVEINPPPRRWTVHVIDDNLQEKLNFDDKTTRVSPPDVPSNPPDNGTNKDSTAPSVNDKKTQTTLESTPSVKTDNTQEESKLPPAMPPDDKKPSTPPQQELNLMIDRVEVTGFINKLHLTSYEIRDTRQNDYFKSLIAMSWFLQNNKFYATANVDMKNTVIEKIHVHSEQLKHEGKWTDLARRISTVRLLRDTFDVFDKNDTPLAKNYSLFSSSSYQSKSHSNIESNFEFAERKLKSEGIANAYVKRYFDDKDLSVNPDEFKIDVIAFAFDEDCMNSLQNWAQEEYHGLIDDYAKQIPIDDKEEIRAKFNSITAEGDKVSKHLFFLPSTVQAPKDEGGKEYTDHLFVDENSRTAKVKFQSSWEQGLIGEEQKHSDFVCWLRNVPRASWALCLPYEMSNETKGFYPDFIIVRKDTVRQYAIDILEPHRGDLNDNLPKAKALAKWAGENNTCVYRVQLVRKSKDAAGNERFRRLDLGKSAVRQRVSTITTNTELDHLFDTYGFFDQ